MHVFITGGSGQVGTRLTTLLVSKGHTVSGLARSDASAAKVVAAGGTPVLGSLSDLDVLAEASRTADAVVHTAFASVIGNIDWIAACAMDRAAIEACATALASGTSQVEKSKRIFIYTSGMLGNLGDEEAGKMPNDAAPRYLSEILTFDLGKSLGIRAYCMRLPPITHLPSRVHPFLGVMIAAAKKNGFAPYVGDGAACWPSVHYDDAVKLYVKVLESDPATVPNCVSVHPVHDKAISNKQFAEIIAKKLGMGTKSISPQEAMQQLGFVGMLAQFDTPVAVDKTKKWFNWEPTGQSLLDEIQESTLDDWKM